MHTRANFCNFSLQKNLYLFICCYFFLQTTTKKFVFYYCEFVKFFFSCCCFLSCCACRFLSFFRSRCFASTANRACIKHTHTQRSVHFAAFAFFFLALGKKLKQEREKEKKNLFCIIVLFKSHNDCCAIVA